MVRLLDKIDTLENVKAAKEIWRFGKTPAKTGIGKSFPKDATPVADVAELI
jgi:hypothetical protein